MKIHIGKIDEIAQKIVDELHPELYVSLDDAYEVADRKEISRLPLEDIITKVLMTKLKEYIVY